MKIQKKSTRSKKAITATMLFAIILLSAGYMGAASMYSFWPFEKINTASVDNTEDKQEANTEDPVQPATEEKPKAEDKSENVETDTPSEDVPQSTKTTMKITSLVNEGGSVKYTAKINGTKKGTCSALFTNAIGKPVTNVHDTSSGFCEGTVPEASFDAYGSWKLTLRFYNDNTQVKDTASVSLERKD